MLIRQLWYYYYFLFLVIRVSVVCSNFVYWHLPQLKYKNPEVQMITLKMMTPTPWIKVYFGTYRFLPLYVPMLHYIYAA